MPGRDIFISYSSPDEAFARLALEQLETEGRSCWFAPRDIPPGEFYAGQIIQALRESHCVLLFFSAHSNASAQVIREINFAVKQRLLILVVRLDLTNLSNDFEYLIRINQWLDVSKLATDEDRIAKIVSYVQTALVKSNSKSSTAKAPVAMRFGDFEILADSSGKPIVLGKGGMGITYRARQISMDGSEVALKVIQPDLLSDDGIRRRFFREATLARSLNHPNVAAVYSRGQEGDSYYYAMELVAGMDLEKYIKANNPLSVLDALNLAAQVASALEAANEKNLIHRDIKPTNLMVRRGRHGLFVKLIDFGLAKDLSQQDIRNSISDPHAFKGTLAYASPEQCQSLELDTRSDLYSLGVTLWFALSGTIPFRGNLVAVSAAHIYKPPPFQELPPIPEPVVELLRSLLAKDPAERPQTPALLEDRLRAILAALPSDAYSLQPEAQPSALESAAAGADSTLLGDPALNAYLEPAVCQTREERFELLEALPEGVSGRLFRARERRGDDTRIVAIKFLHPSLYAEEESAETLKAEFAALQKLTLEPLLRYFALELGSRPPLLVREWVHGLPLTGVLRLKQGILTSPEVTVLLEPLPELLDGLASSGLSLISIRLGKLWARLPLELEPSQFDAWVKATSPESWRDRLALEPLNLRNLAARSGSGESDVTLLPTSRSLALQQNRAGIQGRTPAQLLAAVLYELLSGLQPQAESYRPITAVPGAANRLLRDTLGNAQTFPSAKDFWAAFGLLLPTPTAPRGSPIPEPLPPPQHKASASAPRPTIVQPTAPQVPAKGPAPLSKPPPWRALMLLASLALIAVLAFIVLIGTGSWFAIHQNHPQPQPTPTPESTASVVHTAPLAHTPSTPASLPTGPEGMAREPFNLAFAAAEKANYQLAVTEYSEAIRLRPEYSLAFNNRGVAYEYLHQYDKAIADYSEAIRLKSAFPDAYYNRGNAYYSLSQYDKAIADYSEAILLKPDYVLAYQSRADTYERLGNTDAAARDRAKAKELRTSQ